MSKYPEMFGSLFFISHAFKDILKYLPHA
jgi:hypothetical protein